MNLENQLEYEQILIKILFQNENIRNVVLPHLKPELFQEHQNQNIVTNILRFVNEYKSFPKEHDLDSRFDDEGLHNYKKVLDKNLKQYTEPALLNDIETFFRSRLQFNILAKYAELLQNNKKIDTMELQKVSTFYFDTNVGLEPFQNKELIFDYLHTQDEYIKTSMGSFNYFLGGGFLRPGLTVFVGATNGGKSAVMCSLGANISTLNKKVLYVTLEMSEKRIMRRMITNLFNIDFKSLLKMSKERYNEVFNRVREKVKNNLIIKYFPAKTLNTNKIRHLLRELREKKNFVPDIVFVDYLGLMLPNVATSEANTNVPLERASQELHGLSGENNISVVTAMQFNRQGLKSSDAGMDDVAGSIGTVFTADEVILIKQNEELKVANKYKFEKAKSRDGVKGISTYLNIDYSKMLLYEDQEQKTTEQDQREHETVLSEEEESGNISMDPAMGELVA